MFTGGSYLQCFVPTAGHDTAVVWGFYPVNRFDWPVVLQGNMVKGVRRLGYFLRSQLSCCLATKPAQSASLGCC